MEGFELPAPSFTDFFVFRYLWLVLAILRRAPGRAHRPFKAEAAVELLREAYRDLLKPRNDEEELDEKNPGRWQAFKRFRECLPLLAAPEVGLSVEVAEALIEVIRELGHAPTTKSEWMALQKERLEAVRQAHHRIGMPPPAKLSVAMLNRSAPKDHPWMTLQVKAK